MKSHLARELKTTSSCLTLVLGGKEVNDYTDIAAYWADPSKAKKELDWAAKHSLDQMMEDSWRWQKNNPEGYNN